MRSARLDQTDWRILRELQADGRITNVELARKVGISAPPCLRRVRALEEAGIDQAAIRRCSTTARSATTSPPSPWSGCTARPRPTSSPSRSACAALPSCAIAICFRARSTSC